MSNKSPGGAGTAGAGATLRAIGEKRGTPGDKVRVAGKGGGLLYPRLCLRR